MTANPTPETTSPTSPGTDPRDEPHPLSSYVQGVLRLYFSGGAVVERAVSQQESLAVHAMTQDARTDDRVDWRTPRWFQWDPSQLVFTSFDAHRDQTWRIDPDERPKLERAGHRYGVVASLVDYWGRQDRQTEPSYSARAIVALHHFARDGADPKVWEAAARALEGQSGAALLALAHSQAERGDSIAVDLDEATEGGHEEPGEPDVGSDINPSDGDSDSKSRDDDSGADTPADTGDGHA